MSSQISSHRKKTSTLRSMRGEFWKGVQGQWSVLVVLLFESLKDKGRLTNNVWNSRWKETNMKTKPINQRISVNSRHKKFCRDILETSGINIPMKEKIGFSETIWIRKHWSIIFTERKSYLEYHMWLKYISKTEFQSVI